MKKIAIRPELLELQRQWDENYGTVFRAKQKSCPKVTFMTMEQLLSRKFIMLPVK